MSPGQAFQAITAILSQGTIPYQSKDTMIQILQWMSMVCQQVYPYLHHLSQKLAMLRV